MIDIVILCLIIYIPIQENEGRICYSLSFDDGSLIRKHLRRAQKRAQNV